MMVSAETQTTKHHVLHNALVNRGRVSIGATGCGVRRVSRQDNPQ